MSEIRFDFITNIVAKFQVHKQPDRPPSEVFNNLVPRQNQANQKSFDSPAQTQGGMNNPLNQDIVMVRSELASLNTIDKSLLLKDLLNLPKEFKDLLSMISGKTAGNLDVVDLSKLFSLMDANGKVALDKLMKMTSDLNKMGVYDTSTLKELQAIINACVSAGGANASQDLKNILLLYLPWLPLGAGIGFELDVDGVNAGSENETDQTVTILILTENYGNVKVVLVLEEANSVKSYITASESFPKEELLKSLKVGAKQLNVQNEITYAQKKKDEAQEQAKEAKVKLVASSQVSSVLVLMAQNVIKSIIEIDKSFSLQQARKKMLDKKNN